MKSIVHEQIGTLYPQSPWCGPTRRPKRPCSSSPESGGVSCGWWRMLPRVGYRCAIGRPSAAGAVVSGWGSETNTKFSGRGSLFLPLSVNRQHRLGAGEAGGGSGKTLHDKRGPRKFSGRRTVYQNARDGAAVHRCTPHNGCPRKVCCVQTA